MRVAALDLPAFSLQVALRDRPDLVGRPILLVTRERGVDRVVAVSAEARAQGAGEGQTASHAQSLVQGTEFLRLDEARCTAALQALAEALYALAPTVELAPPDAVLLDASAARLLRGRVRGERTADEEGVGSASVSEGLEPDPVRREEGAPTRPAQLSLAMASRRSSPAEPLWGEAVLETARVHGFVGRIAIAPTAACARMLAASEVPGAVRIAVGASAAAEVPLEIVRKLSLERGSLPTIASTTFEMLEEIGLSRLGDVVRIPAKSLASRIGVDGDRLVLLARGGTARPLMPFTPAQHVAEALSFDVPVELADGLVFALRPVVERLASRMEARGLATSRLVLLLDRLARSDEEVPRPSAPPGELPALARVTERLVFDLARPAAEAKALLDVLRDRLRDLVLTAPVTGVRVEAAETVDRMRQLALGERPRAWEALDGAVARLQARFGEAAVGALATTDDWLPERETARAPFRPSSVVWSEAKQPSVEEESEPEGLETDEPGRPTRLFVTPEELATEFDEAGRLRSVVWRGLRRRVLGWGGVERIARDWWSAEQVRDYTTLQLGDGPRIWAYRDEEGRWWAQGVHD